MEKVKFDKDRVFFTSDLHFGHKNIISFCGRPFSSIKEMDEKLIENWNNTVPKDGIVFILGDISFYSIVDTERIFKRLNGVKYLVLGNHDYKLYSKYKERLSKLFVEINGLMHIHIGKDTFFLSHYPLLCYPNPLNNYNLHGHVHTAPGMVTMDIYRCRANGYSKQYDVGIDNNYYAPISLNEIYKKLD